MIYDINVYILKCIFHTDVVLDIFKIQHNYCKLACAHHSKSSISKYYNIPGENAMYNRQIILHNIHMFIAIVEYKTWPFVIPSGLYRQKVVPTRLLVIPSGQLDKRLSCIIYLKLTQCCVFTTLIISMLCIHCIYPMMLRYLEMHDLLCCSCANSTVGCAKF